MNIVIKPLLDIFIENKNSSNNNNNNTIINDESTVTSEITSELTDDDDETSVSYDFKCNGTTLKVMDLIQRKIDAATRIASLMYEIAWEKSIIDDKRKRVPPNTVWRVTIDALSTVNLPREYESYISKKSVTKRAVERAKRLRA
jgi:hypothetical protein